MQASAAITIMKGATQHLSKTRKLRGNSTPTGLKCRHTKTLSLHQLRLLERLVPFGRQRSQFFEQPVVHRREVEARLALHLLLQLRR